MTQTHPLIGSVRRVRTGKVTTQQWSGRTINTGAAKIPRDGRIPVSLQGLDGDEQGNLKVHGGPNKAICCYPYEFLDQWRADGIELPEGALFENLTLEGLTDRHVHLGDIYQLDDLRVQVTQPRRPCATVSARWSMKELPRLMQTTNRTGFYFRVLEPGTVAQGDTLRLIQRLDNSVSIAETNRIMNVDRDDVAGIHQLLASPELPERWRGMLERRLDGKYEDDSARLFGTS